MPDCKSLVVEVSLLRMSISVTFADCCNSLMIFVWVWGMGVGVGVGVGMGKGLGMGMGMCGYGQ